MPRRNAKVFEDLIVAVLSVNGYQLEQCWAIRDRLRVAGLLDPERLDGLRPQDISELLKAAGYDRGLFLTQLLAERLHAVGQYVVAHGSVHVSGILKSGDVDEVQKLLLPAKGIGPMVVRNFLLLRAAPQTDETE